MRLIFRFAAVAFLSMAACSGDERKTPPIIEEDPADSGGVRHDVGGSGEVDLGSSADATESGACTVDFNNVGPCAEHAAVCGVTVTGNDCEPPPISCKGPFNYPVTSEGPLQVEFSRDLEAVEFYLASEGDTATGTIVFQDADGMEVGSAVSNGDCIATFPDSVPNQRLDFDPPARSASITVDGEGTVWFGDITVNPD